MKPSGLIYADNGSLDFEIDEDGDLLMGDSYGDGIIIDHHQIDDWAATLKQVLKDHHKSPNGKPIVTLTHNHENTHMATNIIYEQRQTECYGGPSHIVIDQRGTDGSVMVQALIRPEYFDQFISMLYDAKAQHDAIAKKASK